jgi:CheY-like chemotaxis protein
VSGDRILVVDDNVQNLKLARFILTGHGYEVRTAPNAEAALHTLETFVPRAILMDLQLPGIDGLALTRRLKHDPRWRGIVVIALTAYAMKGDRERALSAGCNAYIPKPVDVDALARIVADVIASGDAAR